MNIPERYQIFDTRVTLTSKDEERLAQYLASWVPLSKVIFKSLNEADLMRLVVMELSGERREYMLKRLLSRIGSLARKRITARMHAAARVVQSRKESVV